MKRALKTVTTSYTLSAEDLTDLIKERVKSKFPQGIELDVEFDIGIVYTDQYDDHGSPTLQSVTITGSQEINESIS